MAAFTKPLTAALSFSSLATRAKEAIAMWRVARRVVGFFVEARPTTMRVRRAPN